MRQVQGMARLVRTDLEQGREPGGACISAGVQVLGCLAAEESRLLVIIYIYIYSYDIYARCSAVELLLNEPHVYT